MNLHGIAAPAIGTVNPFVPGSMRISTGYSTDSVGHRIPAYSTVTGRAQVQALSYKDLVQVQGLNLGGERRSIYFYGEFNAVVRPNKKGGDLVTLTTGPEAGEWLIALVSEQWPDWCKVIVTRQNGATP